jgi:hypothetical protein
MNKIITLFLAKVYNFIPNQSQPETNQHSL